MESKKELVSTTMPVEKSDMEDGLTERE